MTSTADIRASFLDHFAKAGHALVPSAPLVPQNDPTLMFVNAGMVPFKNVFTGLETRPYSTATSSQKCVRAGGKHNDLDNVGYTARHHTFFEMLGNFSFGDYFKEQAITLAWDLLTGTWGLPKDKLTVTVYHTDDEAFGLWKKIAGLPDERIIRIATNDNFWSMGDTGPCGPCSEIFYDHGAHIPGGPPGSPDEDGDRFVEVWNLVFMQFDQQPDGTRLNLPRPSIDTGMGLERIAAVLQGTHDNFEIDIFKQLIGESAALTKTPTDAPNTRASHRVIADHLRSAGFLVADGVLPANEGRGYVLRRIMRRAMRHAHLLGASEPLMHRLVPALVSTMGGAFPELVRAQPLIAETLKLEETRFRQTLQNGLKLLDEATANLKPGAVLPGDVAFRLYDTYGFPYDLTEDALKAQGLGVDRLGFDASMAEQKARARAAWAGSGANATDSLWFDLVEKLGATDFIGYSTTDAQGEIVALVKDGAEVAQAQAGDELVILTNQTPFYAESGGQVGDTGVISLGDARFEVTDTQKPLGKLHAHFGRLVSGTLKLGDAVQLTVDAERRAQVKANHSATHLMHAALRRVLGAHVAQKGSLVAPDKLRFDFSHQKPMTADEIAAVEADVNAEIRANLPVGTRLMTPDAAIEAGALALFGEKYGDEVRVLSMGRAGDGGRSYSVELCGGTHVNATGDIALFRILSESAVSSGVRRIEALTGVEALKHLVHQENLLKQTAASVKARADEVPDRVAALADTVKKLERELADTKKALALAGPGQSAEVALEQLGDVPFLGRVIEDLDPKELRGLLDEEKQRHGSGVFAIVATRDGRASIAVSVSADLAARANAVELVRAGVAALGGQGGGGRPDMAQGGGPDAGKAADAIQAVKAVLSPGGCGLTMATVAVPAGDMAFAAHDSPRIAIIDIGSNSVRLVVYKGLTRTPAVLFNEKVMAGLGKGLSAGGQLSEESMDVALSALARFALLCDSMGVDSLRAVATAAVRYAANGAEFVARVAAATGIEVETIDGETEARGAAFGVIAGIPQADGVVGDLGGGSLELVRIAGGEAHERLSLPLGSLRLDAFRKKGRRELTQRIDEGLKALKWAGLGNGKPFYAVGGSWRALTQLYMHQTDWPLPVTHHHVMPADAPERLVRTLAHISLKSLKDVPAISSSRVPQLPGAAALLRAITKRLGSSCIISSAYGLREGLLFQALSPAARRQDPLLSAAREAAERLGRFSDGSDSDVGEALLAFTDTLFAGEAPGTRRIRHAACLLADTSWRAHPDMRAEDGLDLALHGTWVGIDAAERAMLAMALWVVNGGAATSEAIAVLSQLADADQLARARLWGQALRLGQRLGGGAADALKDSRLLTEPGWLVLSLPRADEALYAEPVQRRHRYLAQALALEPKLRLH